MAETYFIVGGAGFIGSHFVDRLLAHSEAKVIVFDNFSSGRRWHLDEHSNNRRLKVIEGDVSDQASLANSMSGSDVVIHLASNPDIARAATDPSVDFDDGTLLTHRVVEAMRLSSTPRILYASGSGVYGDYGEVELHEDFGPLIPISTYGASKLAGEALIAAYSYMFGMSGFAFRFGNVVGARQTHGVGFDFVRSLLRDPHRLKILGDGSQSKSYVHVDDVVDAVLLVNSLADSSFGVFNVATLDYVTVKEIANLAAECLRVDPTQVTFEFSGGERGWKGDVPVVRLNTDRIRSLGWRSKFSSREALQDSMEAILAQARAGLL